MRKLLAFLLVAVMLAAAFPAAALAAAQTSSTAWFDAAKLGQGVIGINYKSTGTARVKLMVTKGTASYTYDLAADGTEEFFPLQLGNGSYKVAVLENTAGNKYKSIYSKSVELTLKNANAVYLGDIQNISWSKAELTVQKAAELTKNLASDSDKVKAIYEYVIGAIDYDQNLAVSVATGYIPDVDDVLTAGKGICYDYASLFAAMARSVGIPTKLMMGTSDYVKEYHAWNEVYVGDKWVVVDTTIDAASGKGQLAKDADKYKAVKFY
ncbi:MAG: transglutaminase [Paenibacillaceae bacterium]|nr:transglutaminase [Paenibacillaceae bacterium]